MNADEKRPRWVDVDVRMAWCVGADVQSSLRSSEDGCCLPTCRGKNASKVVAVYRLRIIPGRQPLENPCSRRCCPSW